MGYAVVTFSRSVIVWLSFIFKLIVWCCVDGAGFTMTTIATDKHTFKVYCTTQPEKPSAARMYLAGISQNHFSAKKQFNKYFVKTLHLSMYVILLYSATALLLAVGYSSMCDI